MKIRRILLAVLMVATVLLAGAYAFRAQLALVVAKKIATDRLSTDAVAELPDGLHVGLCGAGSPFPDDRRAGPCTLVVAGKRMFVFDAGDASARNIGKMGFNQGHVEAIFLTHFHSDHIDGLGQLMLQRWISQANTAPVPVYGPPGVEAVLAGFMQAYEQDQHYRVTHHGQQAVPAGGFGGVAKPFTIGADGRVMILKDDDLEIMAFLVDHAPVHPAVGYSIRYKDRSVVLSGDTKKSATVQRAAADVDLLVHDAISPPLVAMLQEGANAAGRPNLKKIFGDILDYHATPGEVAEIARDAKVRFLLLNHIVPTLPALPGMEKLFLGSASAIYDGPVRVGIDGDFVSLPAGSTEILASRRF